LRVPLPVSCAPTAYDMQIYKRYMEFPVKPKVKPGDKKQVV